ncbi:MAG: N-acetyl-alpha-D-glucosaminyl L-malate synthase BshA [Vicinamibacterales bacterium]
MRIGIVCYASIGGSGVVATELAHSLALRGHTVRLISSERPFRWRDGLPELGFDRVDTPAYPLFREPQYLLALATAIARLACEHHLDVVHAHYAVPHATAAYLADEMLRADADAGGCRPRTVTTLHGTDVTLVGSDPSYRRVVAFSIEQSSAVTAVSESLRRDTQTAVGVRCPIEVIPNFLDCDAYRRQPNPALRARFATDDQVIVLHASNFRPVKRVGLVLDVFLRIRAARPARLLLIGDGPDRPALEAAIAAAGASDAVTFLGEVQDPVPWLSLADLFLLPSSQESFGLAALEAMACGVPVAVSRVGGLPEVVTDDDTGLLCDPDDAAGMAGRILALLADRDAAARMGRRAAAVARERFCVDAIVPRYEALYARVVAPPQPASPSASGSTTPGA